MESRAKLFGHPLHLVLIVLPLGFLAAGVIFDIFYLFSVSSITAAAAYWMITAGIIGGVLAAIFGWLDWWAIPDGTRAKTIGLVHGVGNMFVLLLFIVSWGIRHNEPERPETIANILSIVGAGLALITVWLGRQLTERLGLEKDADQDEPNALSSEGIPPNTTIGGI